MTYKIIIAGSNGYLGRNIYEYFLTKPNFEVKNINRSDFDLTSTQKLHDFVSEFKPDFYIHSAVNINDFENNIKMHYSLEAISNVCGKIITLGSGAEYNPKAYKPLMKEEYFGNSVPEDIYSLSKYTIARLINEGSANIYNLRLFGIFGKYEDYTRRFISNNLVRHLNHLPLKMNRDIAFDYLYVPDFLQSLEAFLLTDPPRNTYNLCTGKPLSFLYMLHEICNVLEINKDEIIIVDQTPSEYEYSGDPSLFNSDILPVKITPFSTCIQQMYDWYIEQNFSFIEQ